MVEWRELRIRELVVSLSIFKSGIILLPITENPFVTFLEQQPETVMCKTVNGLFENTRTIAKKSIDF